MVPNLVPNGFFMDSTRFCPKEMRGMSQDTRSDRIPARKDWFRGDSYSTSRHSLEHVF